MTTTVQKMKDTMRLLNENGCTVLDDEVFDIVVDVINDYPKLIEALELAEQVQSSFETLMVWSASRMGKSDFKTRSDNMIKLRAALQDVGV